MSTFLCLSQWCFWAKYLREGGDEQGKHVNYFVSRIVLELWVDFCSKVGRATMKAEGVWDMLQTPEIALEGQQCLAKALAVFSDITDAPSQEFTWNVASDFRKGILQTFSDFYPGVYTPQQLRAAELNPPPAPPVRKPEDEVDEAVALHTNALGMVVSDHFAQNGVDGGVNKPGQRDGIIYGPCFGLTSFTSLMLVSTSSRLYEEWREERMTPNNGTSGEVFEHVSDMCASPSAIWRWTASRKKRADMSKRYTEAPALRFLMVGSGVLSALYTCIPTGLVTSSMTQRMLSMCVCAHVWICAWNTLCSSHLTGKKYEKVFYRYPDMCMVIAQQLGNILTHKANQRDIDKDVNVFYYLVEALCEVVKQAKVAVTYHSLVCLQPAIEPRCGGWDEVTAACVVATGRCATWARKCCCPYRGKRAAQSPGVHDTGHGATATRSQSTVQDPRAPRGG